MNILHKTVFSLSKEEIINYKLYANRTQSNKDRKDIHLFDLIKKQFGKEVNDEQISQKLYPNSSNKNSYFRLKNRLHYEITNSLVQFYFNETDTHYIYNELSLYKIFFAKNEWDIALYHLKKAEKKATQIQDFGMLDVIYTEHIQLSIHYGEFAPSNYIEKRIKNKLNLNSVRDLDDALANIIYELKRSQTFSKAKNHTSDVLNKAINNLNTKKEFKNNLVFKNKLYNAVSRLLLAKKDFESLEHYTLTTYNEFLKKHYFSKNNHETKLQMLAYLCNTLFVNKKHALALKYIEELHNAMKEFKNLLYNNYVFFYYNSLVNNYSFTNPQKSVEILNKAKELDAIVNHPAHLGYVYLNLAGAYFDLQQYKIALKNIIKLYNHKVFETIDDSFKIKIHITEIILRIELRDYEYAFKLVEMLMKNYKKALKSIEYKQDFDFLSLLKVLIDGYNMAANKQSKLLVQQFCATSYKQNSTNIVNYNQWLIKKYNLTE